MIRVCPMKYDIYNMHVIDVCAIRVMTTTATMDVFRGCSGLCAPRTAFGTIVQRTQAGDTHTYTNSTYMYYTCIALQYRALLVPGP